MRKAPLIAAGFILAAAGQAFAAGTSNMPSTDAPMQSTTQTAPPSSSPSTSAPSTGSATGSASDTAATAGSAAATPAALSVGEPVKDNTGATIGAIASLSTGSTGQQMAVIKMGNDSFQVPADRLGVASGAATINLSQAQITTMLHPAAGGK